MKAASAFIFALLWSGFTAPFCLARDQSAWQVRIDVQMVSIPTTRALELGPKFKDPKRSEAAFAVVQDLLASGDADLLGWPVVQMYADSTVPGKATTGSSVEVRFPTEFDPPKLPSIFSSPPPIPPTDVWQPEPQWGSATPTAWETRNCGPALDAEVAVSALDGQILLQLNPEFVRFLGYHTLRGCPDALGIDGIIEQPEFVDLSVKSKFHLRNGERMLAGSFVTPGLGRRTVFFLLHAVATRAKDSDRPSQLTASQPSPWLISVESRTIVLSQKSALPLVALAGDDAKSGEAWDKAERLVESGEATLSSIQIATARSGEQIVTGTLSQMSYPTEYEPSLFPKWLPENQISDVLQAWPLMGPSPTAFSRRDIGESLRFEGIVTDDGGWVDVSVDSEDVHFLESQHFDGGELPGGERLGLDQPVFEDLHDSQKFRMRNGGKLLFAVHKLAKPEPSFELRLLRVSARKIDSAPR